MRNEDTAVDVWAGATLSTRKERFYIKKSSSALMKDVYNSSAELQAG